MIGKTPDWVKTGAKIVGTSAIRNLGDYMGDVQAGADPKMAKKRAAKSTFADILEESGKKMRGSGKKCCKSLAGSGKKRKTKKKIKKVPQKKKRSIKRRTKFDLLSV